MYYKYIIYQNNICTITNYVRSSKYLQVINSTSLNFTKTTYARTNEDVFNCRLIRSVTFVIK